MVILPNNSRNQDSHPAVAGHTSRGQLKLLLMQCKVGLSIFLELHLEVDRSCWRASSFEIVVVVLVEIAQIHRVEVPAKFIQRHEEGVTIINVLIAHLLLGSSANLLPKVDIR